MTSEHQQGDRPFLKERQEFHRLLEQNPNYFGQLGDSKFKPVEEIKGNTSFEQLHCVGLYPERNTVEAILEVKRPYGFGGDLCHRPTHEYVRFYLDWDRDGDFDMPDEDLGFVSLEVHDFSEVIEGRQQTHICYGVARHFKPHPSRCDEPYIIKLRAVLAWEQIPTSPDFPMVWGNIVECHVQIDPEGTARVVPSPEALKSVEHHGHLDPHRERFLRLLQENPNFFGTAEGASLAAENEKKFDTTYEQLRCIGLYPEEDLLEAIFTVKLPYGFGGPLCGPGSHEFVRFYVDWDRDGDFTDPDEDVGFATVRVHDIPEVRPGDPRTYLCYAVAHVVRTRRHSTCKTPLIVPARAVLSWQVLPPGPNGPVVWGNIVTCNVQFRPTQQPPPLVGQIDTPAADACALPVDVPACSGSSPLHGVEITGSAHGGLFSHYTLSYTWPGGPATPIDTAVVYPGCGRPPAQPSSTTQVFSGTLGWLDRGLLPFPATHFTVFLDVYDTGSGHIQVSRTFEAPINAIEITAVAAVNVVEGQDPFHPSPPDPPLTLKLIKSVDDGSVTVPELSVGGAFSVYGSASVAGCGQRTHQYILVYFPAPPASIVPTPPNASGGTPLITAVDYPNTVAKPDSSGCFFSTPNFVVNGVLTSSWTVVHCWPSGTVPKVLALNPPPDTAGMGLNGRYVILLEVQSRPVGAPGPVTIRPPDQVAVWIDNQEPVAAITQIGGMHGCLDLHLKDYVGTTVEIRGRAWDPPIDPTAPQHKPNDNFGGYSMSFQKNGGAGGPISVPAAPQPRVPNEWPAILSPDGTLTNWDIVNALDASSPTPTPGIPASAKLGRGERCAYLISLSVSDTTHVGDSGSNHTAYAPYAVNIINDVP